MWETECERVCNCTGHPEIRVQETPGVCECATLGGFCGREGGSCVSCRLRLRRDSVQGRAGADCVTVCQGVRHREVVQECV